MTLIRLVPIVLLLSSLPAATQASKSANGAPGNISNSHNQFLGDFSVTAATPSEPWRLIPDSQGADAGSENRALDHLRMNDYRGSQFKGDDRANIVRPDSDGGMFFPNLKPRLNTDTTCYSIRSYVVARDSKDSDSTHPAGYSTCQPSDRYRLKSTEIRVESPDR